MHFPKFREYETTVQLLQKILLVLREAEYQIPIIS